MILLKNQKNATFLHNAGYMHYHSDRFNDCSLILKEDDKIVALLPGNIDENSVFLFSSRVDIRRITNKKMRLN